MATTLNMFDLIFIGATLLIVIIAFFRGFVRELFSLINWVIAGLLVYLLSPYIAKPLQEITGSVTVANIISSSFVFIAVYILTSITTRKVASACKEKIPYTTDQILGIVFGALKSCLLFGFIYASTLQVYGSIYDTTSKSSLQERMPSWLYQSKFRTIIAPFARLLDPVAKTSISESEERFLGKGDVKGKESKKPAKKKNKNRKKLNEEKSEPYGVFGKSKKAKEERAQSYRKTEKKPIKIKKTKKVSENYEEKGYSKKEIEKMDRLIEIIE